MFHQWLQYLLRTKIIGRYIWPVHMPKIIARVG